MNILWVCLSIGAVALLIWVYLSYENKVKLVLDNFREKNKRFYNLAEGFFEVKTNHKKVGTWNIEHAIDFVINNNAQQLVEELKNFNDLKVWWIDTIPDIKREVLKYAEILSMQMFILGGLFKNRVDREINCLANKYNPENVKIRLITYTYYERGEMHYNKSMGEMTTNESSSKNITFAKEISVDELYERIKFLSQHNFTITKYQYDCENQRSLMTPQLRHEIILRDKSTCQNCGKRCLNKEIEIDHIQPISKGGKTILSNLQVLCVRCNRQKSNKWLESFYDFKQNNYEYEQSNKSNKSSLQSKTEIKSDENKCNNCFIDNKNGNMRIKNTICKIEDDNKCMAIKKTSNIQDNNSIIKWIKIDSLQIIQVYYNVSKKSLYIMFKGGEIYVYYNVETSIFMEFLSSSSKGAYVCSELYKYDYQKIGIDDVE